MTCWRPPEGRDGALLGCPVSYHFPPTPLFLEPPAGSSSFFSTASLFAVGGENATCGKCDLQLQRREAAAAEKYVHPLLMFGRSALEDRCDASCSETGSNRGNCSSLVQVYETCSFHLGFSSPLMISHEFLLFSYHDKISAERFPLAGGTFNQHTFISSGLFTSNHLGRADMMDDSGLRHAPKRRIISCSCRVIGLNKFLTHTRGNPTRRK